MSKKQKKGTKFIIYYILQIYQTNTKKEKIYQKIVIDRVTETTLGGDRKGGCGLLN